MSLRHRFSWIRCVVVWLSESFGDCLGRWWWFAKLSHAVVGQIVILVVRKWVKW